MANLKLSFTIREGVFSLCATTINGGTKSTPSRNYKKVEGLQSPNLACWDKKLQIFNEPTQEAIDNNNVLREMKERYQRLIDLFNPTSGKELFSLNEKAEKVEAKTTLTFGGFIQSLINTGKNESIKKPSKNYQKYIDLLNKLKKEGNIINKPLEDIANKDFIAFRDFILHKLTKEEGQSNYLNLMKLFKAAHNRAVSLELNEHILKYPYTKDAPPKKSKERFAFTEQQYRKFVEFDLNKIPQSGCNPMYYKELYRDFCIFLYEMKMRPGDVIKLHSLNINNCILKYTPEKKKNYIDELKRITINKITPTAKAIINKYKGQSAKGYIFPFSMNNYDWDFEDAKSWNRWHNRKQKTLQDINEFLHKFEKPLKINGTITTYSFRHSALTHAVNKKDCNLMQIAKESGTSVKMLEQHYYHLYK